MIEKLLAGAGAGGVALLIASSLNAQENQTALAAMADSLVNRGYTIENIDNEGFSHLVDTMIVHGLVLRKADNPDIGRATGFVEMYDGEVPQELNDYWDNILNPYLRGAYSRIAVKYAPDEVTSAMVDSVESRLPLDVPTSGLDGSYNPPVQTEQKTWGAIKGMFKTSMADPEEAARKAVDELFGSNPKTPGKDYKDAQRFYDRLVAVQAKQFS